MNDTYNVSSRTKTFDKSQFKKKEPPPPPKEFGYYQLVVGEVAKKNKPVWPIEVQRLRDEAKCFPQVVVEDATPIDHDLRLETRARHELYQLTEYIDVLEKELLSDDIDTFSASQSADGVVTNIDEVDGLDETHVYSPEYAKWYKGRFAKDPGDSKS